LSVPGVLVTAVTAFRYVRAAHMRSITQFLSYNELYDVFHAVIIVYVAIGVWNIVRSYRNAATSADKRRLQWIAWGIAVGPAPFLLLSVIPQFFQPGALVPELYTLPFLVLIPFSFVVSFVRHRLLDIELVIRRTTAYAIVLIILLGLYMLLVGVVAAAVGAMTASAAAAVVVALLLEPLRSRIQHAVDRSFFRVQYDLHRTEKRMVEEIRLTLDEADLARLLVHGVAELIPLERIGMYSLSPGPGPAPRFLLGLGQGFAPPPELPASLLETCARGLPVAHEGALEPEIPCTPGDPAELDRLGLALLVPMLSDAGLVLGLLAVGRKKAGNRFTPQDVDLLAMLAVQAGLALRRFALQHDLFAEHAEAQRLAALNQLKSDFVSYVSHELRTPLTSIKMFAELMAVPERGLDPKAREYLAIIQGESDRLGHMVSTILDSARIEQGGKVYEMKDVDLRDAADAAMQAMQFQLAGKHFAVRYLRPRRAIPVRGDVHALTDALVNLIANAIKYSAAVRRLRVQLTRAGAEAVCTVKDRGIGITADALPRIFEKFYRDPGSSRRVDGIGLGLPLVKHIVEAHQGSITVESTPGTGTTFTLRLPLRATTPRPITSRRMPNEYHTGH
ncbi:MAG TPA: GAF domain-containing sensor histidine kinase, partial [Bacteroidota bacterium]